MNVIPAIDLLDGQVVRLKKGDYNEKTVYSDDPITFAQQYRDAGFSHIHVVDLNGAREGTFKNLDKIRQIISKSGLSVQSGGGVRTFKDAKTLLDSGISKVVCSSMPVKSPDDWQQLMQLQQGKHAILGLDIKDGKMAYSGWEKTSEGDPMDFLEQMISGGLREILCTDISRDGMLSGVNHQLYQDIKSRFPSISIIASGGVASAEDLTKLQSHNIDSVVVGRAFYEGYITLDEMIQHHHK